LRGLDRADHRPDGGEIARLAGDLAKAGVFHPDLHPGNQLPLVDGRLAVLDLHSARLARPGLSRRQRLIVASRLIGEPGPLAEDPVPLVRAGLLQDAELVVVRRLVARNSRRQLVARVRRCFRHSTEFQRCVQWNGVLYQRRGPMSGGTWIFGGRELVRWWIGDRALEVFEGRPPALRALFRRATWLPGRHSVYIEKPLDRAALSVLIPTMLEGYTAFRRLLQGETPPEAGVGPRSGTQGD
jgi:hypothetical protein